MIIKVLVCPFEELRRRTRAWSLSSLLVIFILFWVIGQSMLLRGSGWYEDIISKVFSIQTYFFEWRLWESLWAQDVFLGCRKWHSSEHLSQSPNWRVRKPSVWFSYREKIESSNLWPLCQLNSTLAHPVQRPHRPLGCDPGYKWPLLHH